MKYIDALILVRTAADNEILHWTDKEKKHIVIYHKANHDGTCPEGWYIDKVEDIAQDVRNNTHAQDILISRLHQKNVDIQWHDPKLK